MCLIRSVLVLCAIFLVCVDLSFGQAYDYDYNYDDTDDGLTPAPRTRPPRPPRRRPSNRRDRGRDRQRERERQERERAERERQERERAERERAERERTERERAERENAERERQRAEYERAQREREAREREEREIAERERIERERAEREEQKRQEKERGRTSTRDRGRNRDRDNERDRRPPPTPRPTRQPRPSRPQTNSCGCPNDIEYSIHTLNEFVSTTTTENERTYSRLEKAEQDIRELRELIGKLNDQSTQWSNSLRFPGLSVINAPNHIALTDDGVMSDETFRDCQEVLDKGYSQRGVYNINPDNSAYVSLAFCQDGWTIIQRRFDGSTDFYKTYDEYIEGFGNFTGEFWLGLEIMHQISIQDEYTLRVDLESQSGKFYFSVYSGFHVGSEEDDFKLDYLNMTSGTGKDGLKPNRGRGFSTRGHDRDNWRYKSCANHYKSGFWLDRCGSDLNRNPNKGVFGGTKWGGRYMKSSLMRIKPSKSMRRKDYRATP